MPLVYIQVLFPATLASVFLALSSKGSYGGSGRLVQKRHPFDPPPDRVSAHTRASAVIEWVPHWHGPNGMPKGVFPPPLPPPKPSREQWAVLKFFIPFLLPPRRSPFGLCARYEGQKEKRLEPPSFLSCSLFCIQDPHTADWRNCFYRSLDPPPPTPPLPNTGVPKGQKGKNTFWRPVCLLRRSRDMISLYEGRGRERRKNPLNIMESSSPFKGKNKRVLPPL